MLSTHLISEFEGVVDDFTVTHRGRAVLQANADDARRPGDQVSVSVTVCNQGTTPGAAPVDLVLSSDAIIALPLPSSPVDPSADRLLVGALFELQAGVCSTQSLRTPVSSLGPDGTNFLGAVADFPNSLVELNETNNTSRSTPIGLQ